MHKELSLGTSLVVWWLRICLAMQGPPPPEKDLESPSSTHLEALVPSHDSRAMTRSPSPREIHGQRILESYSPWGRRVRHD